MVDLTHSIRIEALLKKVCPSLQSCRDSIQSNPYQSIMNILSIYLPRGAILFAEQHKQTDNKSIPALVKENYNIDRLIKDLKNIIYKGE